jgi:threonyl-tRNA synthetase
VFKVIEEMEYVTRAGCPQGFVHLLPKGVMFNQRTMSYNRDHLEAFQAALFQPSNIFSLSDPEIRDLTASFENSSKMFRLASPDENLRLGYATDPMLFKWLQGKTLLSDRLPYTVFTNLPGFRRIPSGSIGGLDRLRQYDIPDLHIFCQPQDSLDLILTHFKEAGKVARAWFQDEFVHFIDVIPDLGMNAILDLAKRAALAMKQFTWVNVLAEQSRYYTFRSGVMVYGGFGNVMLHNTQLDEQNGSRFRIKTKDGAPASIIHATVAGGVHKLLPLMVGRGISGLGPRRIPLELAPTQVLLLPVTPAHLPSADAFMHELNRMDITARLLVSPVSLSKRMQLCRKYWDPCVSVIGDMETDPNHISIELTDKKLRYSVKEFLALFGERIRQGNGGISSFRLDLPY